MDFFISCPYGLESVLNNEIKMLWYKVDKVTPKWVYFQWDLDCIPNVNLWSRVWNKLYMVLKKWKVHSFEDLFQLVYSVKWSDILPKSYPILVNWYSKNSQLESIPTIQSISKKSIVNSMLWWKDWNLYEDPINPNIEVLVWIENNECTIFLNTTWESLHRRWYKKLQVEAPIKENLAAWLILMCNWKFSNPFYDPFCGSWTFVIEALMIAKNIAPWMNRNYNFEHFSWINSDLLDSLKLKAKDKIFNQKKYQIFASDIDTGAIEITKSNAKNIWLEEEINFEVCSFDEMFSKWDLLWTMLSNPPYGKRLKPMELQSLYEDIYQLFEDNQKLNGWIITSYTEFDELIDSDWKQKKLYNWQDEVVFYKKS